ncbi:hypothetical protein JCM8097_001658 [Rhodosporidiobolus ruineniae]
MDAPPPAPTLGKRAQVTHHALLTASNKVIHTLDEKAMLECFPQRWADNYPDLIPGLRDLVVEKYSQGVQLAWDDLVRDAQFIEKANELDDIIADARRRKEAGEEPRELYRLGTDPTVTVPSATVPSLRLATSDLRAKREALAAKNQATYARIAALSTSAAQQEEQNEAILAQFAATVKALGNVDQSALEELQAELVKVVGHSL